MPLFKTLRLYAGPTTAGALGSAAVLLVWLLLSHLSWEAIGALGTWFGGALTVGAVILAYWFSERGRRTATRESRTELYNVLAILFQGGQFLMAALLSYVGHEASERDERATRWYSDQLDQLHKALLAVPLTSLGSAEAAGEINDALSTLMLARAEFDRSRDRPGNVRLFESFYDTFEHKVEVARFAAKHGEWSAKLWNASGQGGGRRKPVPPT